MSSKEEWCADKLSKLLNEELRISTLNEIKDHLQSLPSHEVKPTVNSLDLPLVFDCLNNSNNEQIDLTCEVLSLCLDNLNIGESATKYGISLERALAHPYSSVKLMVLKELERNVKNDDVLVDICKRISLLASIVKCLGYEDLEVAVKASRVVAIIGGSDIGIKKLTSVDLIKVFSDVQCVNEINRLRIYELFIKISKESKISFTYLNAAGLITPILVDLDSDDILLKMNILEILSELGLCEHGYDFLELKQVMYKLSLMLGNDSLDLQLTEPGILKFFGNIGYWKPKDLVEKYPSVPKKMFENFESSDFSLVGVSIDAVGFIATTSDGKFALDSLEIVENGIATVVGKLNAFPTELTIRSLKFIENMLKVETDNHKISLISQKWFFSLNGKPLTEVIMRYAKNPFVELRVAGLNVLLSISNQLWGQEIIIDTPGLIEFLLDRNAEVHKECKEIKYDIIKSLSCSSLLDQQLHKALENYVREGPFYVQGVMEVAFEGND